MTIKRISSKRAVAAGAVALLAAGLAACSSSSSTTTGAAEPARAPPAAPPPAPTQPTLVMESSPENSLTHNFNPFDGRRRRSRAWAPPAWSTSRCYQFDLANPTQAPYPWLATNYAWGNGGKSITFTIRQGVKWNDGTAADRRRRGVHVTSTCKSTAAGPTTSTSAACQLTTRDAPSGNTVTLSFPTPQYMNLREHRRRGDPARSTIWSIDQRPGHLHRRQARSAPARTRWATSPAEGFTMVANPNYWQRRSRSRRSTSPSTPRTPRAQNALFAGQIDWTGNYIPGLQQDFIQQGPGAPTTPSRAANSSSALYPNLNDVARPTELPVRQGDRRGASTGSVIGTEGESGLEAPVLNASGITQPALPGLARAVAGERQPPGDRRRGAGRVRS